MKNHNILILALITTILFSCTTIIKTAYGVKKPRLENPESINSYLVKNEFDNSNLITFKDFPTFVNASQKGYLVFPDAIFFNKDGYNVSYNKTAKACNANVDSFIEDLETFQTYPVNEEFKINEFIQLLSLPDKNNMEIADVNVFITWTIYMGDKLNKEKAFEWIRLLEKAQNEGKSVQFYLLNCDYLQSWNIPKELHKKLGIKS